MPAEVSAGVFVVDEAASELDESDDVLLALSVLAAEVVEDVAPRLSFL